MAAIPTAMQGRSSFPTTRGSILRAAQDESSGVRNRAVGQLYEMYHRPIVSYLRRASAYLGHDPDDLAHGFFLDKVIEGRLLEGFRRERGKFRALLCTALRNYVRDVDRYHKAKRRSPEGATVDVDIAHPQDRRPAPDVLLELDLVRATIARAMLRMRHGCERDGRMDYWYALTHRTAAPIYGREAHSIGQIAEALGLPTRGAASNLLINAQRRLRTALRQEVATYAPNEQDINREIQEFLEVLSNGGMIGSHDGSEPGDPGDPGEPGGRG